MKKVLLTFVIISCIFSTIYAQNGPLKGSGAVISKNFNFTNFDKISFEDFDGSIEVEIGKPFAITVAIDENLVPRLKVKKEENESRLIIALEGNYNGKLYLEKTRIKIKVSLPEASMIEHRGNTIMKINGIFGRYFKLENNGNGNVQLFGAVDGLEIKKTGNGEITANKLLAKTVKVKSYGNGNVLVNAQISLMANGAGNCSVMQFGPGKIDPMSGIIGNGDVKRM
jgi:hypothetical protein